MDSPAQKKSAIRAAIRLRLKQISPDARAQASAAACAILREQAFWASARTILLYSALPDELDLSPLMREAAEAGKCLALPRFDPRTGSYYACAAGRDNDSLVPGRFGIPEPGCETPEIRPNQLDLTLVPGVAFDLMGCRIGRGKGFYDRLLKEISGAKCGVAFDEQIWPDLPMEPHDVKLDYVLTPTRWFQCD